MTGGVSMRRNNRLLILLVIGFISAFLELSVVKGQDYMPSKPVSTAKMKHQKPMRENNKSNDTIASYHVILPAAFRETGRNEITDSLSILVPVLERLRQLRGGLSEDTLRIVHIGDSHVRGHIYPRTTGTLLKGTFGAVSYVDMGVNGATCLTFTHPERIAEIAELKPEMLILSFGTNESHYRYYNANTHYGQMDELITLLREQFPEVPILLTTPPGSYESFRQRRRRCTYAVNPRTASAVATIHRFAKAHHLLVWDMYKVVGGSQYACKNWTGANLMRPDHVHFMPEGYVLQGELLYQALIKAYNEYVSH